MIVRVSLELALRKEFDYLVPPELVGQVEIGSRVQVPFGARTLYGCVTGLAENSDFAALKPIIRVVGAQGLVNAQSPPPGPVDRRILLLRARGGVEIRAAGSGASGAIRLARAFACAPFTRAC